MVFLLQTNAFYFIENNLSDKLTMKTRPVDPRLKIVAIDSESLDKAGSWPWPRAQMAVLAERLAAGGAKAVWLDVLYTEKSVNEAEDKALADVLAKHHNIYLSVYFDFKALQGSEQELEQEYLKPPVFAVAPERIGHTNILADDDHIVRRILLGIPNLKEEIVPIIDVRLANLLLPEGSKITWNDDYVWRRGADSIAIDDKLQVSFAYASVPDNPQFETIPAWKVLQGEIDPAYFRDSIVMIGPYDASLRDQYWTPAAGAPMHGVEIHANIVQALIDNKLYSKSSNTIAFLIVILGVMLLFALFYRLGARIGAVVLAFLIIGYSGIVHYVFHSQAILLPYFYTLLSFILAYVTAAAGHYLTERAEKERIAGVFGRYLPKPAVDHIVSAQEPVKVNGIRQEVTLMFVDIRGFTQLAETMEPEEVIKILNDYLDVCTKAIFKQEGTLDKFMGDGLMGIFGAPISADDHAERAVRAALDIKRESRRLARDLKERMGQAAYFGIGINTGPAVIGNIGSSNRLDYTAIGEAVNLASWLEANAQADQIVISKQTYELVKDSFECTRLEPVSIKRKGQAVEVFQVEREYDEDDFEDDDVEDAYDEGEQSH